MDGRPKRCAGVIRFDFDRMHMVATEVMGLHGPDAAEWVVRQLHDVAAFFSSLKETDFFIGDKDMIAVAVVNGYEYRVLPLDVGLACVLNNGGLCPAGGCEKCVFSEKEGGHAAG